MEGQEGHRGACWHYKGARAVIPLLLCDDKKRRRGKNARVKGERKGGRRGGRGHVGTKRGHVLRQEEGLLGWAQLCMRSRQIRG